MNDSDPGKPTPPPPTRQIRKNVVRREIRAAIITPDPAGIAPEKRYEIEIAGLREAAIFRGFVAFIQHPGLDARQVWESFRTDDRGDAPMIRDVISYEVFRRAARRHRWWDRRTEHWEGVQRRVLETLRTDHVEAELKEIAGLTATEQFAMRYVTGGTYDGKEVAAVKPRSLEGLIAALIAIDRRRSAKRDLVVAATVAAAPQDAVRTEGVPGVVDGPAVEDGMDDEELMAFSREITRKRAGLIAAEDDDAAPGTEGGGEE